MVEGEWRAVGTATVGRRRPRRPGHLADGLRRRYQVRLAGRTPTSTGPRASRASSCTPTMPPTSGAVWRASAAPPSPAPSPRCWWPWATRGRGRRTGRVRGDEDGAHVAGQRRRVGDPGALRTGTTGRRARPAGDGGTGMTTPEVLRVGQLQRLLRGPHPRRPRNGRGRPDRRPHGRLAGRADDVHPAQDPGAHRRVRPHLPARARGGAPDLHRAGHHRRVQRGRARPRGAGRRREGVGPPAGPRRARGLGVGGRHHARLAALQAQGRSSSTSTRASCFPPTPRW